MQPLEHLQRKVRLASVGGEVVGTVSFEWSGKRIKKTRKYDIITTPAERVEMAPLNEEDDEDEDSTVFDVKYRSQAVVGAMKQ
ncbi:hypothetical protein llap_19069 [Limosa lapponica baueri]|uniref:Uncharacterized protein n=1 Tax=Limosa lapponica baueri TaxID=1758121 RepID=A0A2I0T9Z7_LIMLA|nr:hypothetical protein llap_19069 [Limosa lapponica baueri]